MATANRLLEARGLGRRIPGSPEWLLDDVSLTLEAGERLAIGGPSGSGKTLLLRALALLDPVSVGSVLWEGHPVLYVDVPMFRRQVMYLRQRPVALGSVVEECLRQPFSLRCHGSRQFNRQQMVEWLDRLGRGETFLKQRTSDLSGGERQIVALLSVMQLDPFVLLLDEPTAALDPQTARCVEQLLDDWLNDRNALRSMIWIGHDEAACRRMANRQATMRAGRLFFEEQSP